MLLKIFFAFQIASGLECPPYYYVRLNIAYLHPEIFSSMMSLPEVPLGDRLCVSRKGGTGEVGGGFTQSIITHSYVWDQL